MSVCREYRSEYQSTVIARISNVRQMVTERRIHPRALVWPGAAGTGAATLVCRGVTARAATPRGASTLAVCSAREISVEAMRLQFIEKGPDYLWTS